MFFDFASLQFDVRVAFANTVDRVKGLANTFLLKSDDPEKSAVSSVIDSENLSKTSLTYPFSIMTLLSLSEIWTMGDFSEAFVNCTTTIAITAKNKYILEQHYVTLDQNTLNKYTNKISQNNTQ
mmetsp:Transcript_18988/g.31722  ORF Transcript_18988/g.31722 Transcript_18988/m.31722 type:complete len:124 (-) Transcript_18988:16-387(-)